MKLHVCQVATLTLAMIRSITSCYHQDSIQNRIFMLKETLLERAEGNTAWLERSISWRNTMGTVSWNVPSFQITSSVKQQKVLPL